MEIPGFNIIEKIGEGGMATVWKARQISLDRIVALKVLKAQLAVDPEEVKDFIQEARSAAKFKHTNIIQVYDIAEHNGLYYFVMEYVNGPTIANVIADKGRIPPKKAIKIIKYVADALESAWDKSRLIHRDIKPDNIMIDEDGTIKLADLGLAKMVDSVHLSEQFKTGTLEGTPNYISPEQAKCSIRLDCRTDIYSLGATLYHMITGKMPFEEYEPMDALRSHIDGHIPNPRDINSSIPIGFAQLITRLMMKNPDNRYKDWKETCREIKKVASGRILLQKQDRGNESTVEPLKTVSGSEKNKIKTSTIIPLWLRLTSWSILLIWWSILAYNLLKLPSLPPLVQPLKYKKQALVKPAKRLDVKKLKTDKSETVKGYKSKEVAEARVFNQVANSEENEILMFKTTLANHILNEDFNTAMAVIDNEMEYSHSIRFEDAIRNLRKIIEELDGADKLIESSFRSKVGQNVVIHHKGKDLNITIKDVSDGKIVASMKTAMGAATVERQIKFSINKLDPVERVRWISQTDTLSKHIMNFIFMLKNKDYKSAQDVAKQCGPFSEIFLEEAKVRQAK